MEQSPTPPSSPRGPLAAVRVLDMSRILAGPWAGQVFADLGAEVIKVERPVKGDDMRGVGIADLMTGMYSTVAVLSALHERQSSGKGQYIDMALLDTQVAWLANQNMNYLIGGETPVRLGNAHPNVVPYQAFRTADGDLILAIGNDGQFFRFCEAAGIAELAHDPCFADNAARVANRDACVAAIAPVISKKKTLDWVELLEPLGVPCGPINRLDEVFANPQVEHRGLKVDVPHPLAGSVPLVANPIRFSRTPLRYDTPPPLLGQHTEEILGGLLHKSEAEIAALRGAGAI